MSLDITSRMDRPKVLFITPIVPAPTGNGLAMRAAVTLQGLASTSHVTTAVLPVSGPAIDQNSVKWAAARSDRLELIPLAAPAEAVRDWMASREGRTLAAAADWLPSRARLATPSAISNVLAGEDFDCVWVFRLYLAATAIPFRGPRTKLVLDIDEDEAATSRSIATLSRIRETPDAALGNQAEASAYDRYTSHALGYFDWIVTASIVETEALQRRHGLTTVSTIPNAVELGGGWKLCQNDGGSPSILLIGNFDYAPNLDAAERLATSILPIVQHEWPKAELHLVGAGQSAEQFAGYAGVRVHGHLAELASLYKQATMTVVPLRAGGGSRLKILEAFAHGLPVVATSKAVEGLDIRTGTHFLLGESDEELASQANFLASAPNLAAALAVEAARYVEAHHDTKSIGRLIADLASA